MVFLFVSVHNNLTVIMSSDFCQIFLKSDLRFLWQWKIGLWFFVL
jgi:hypothetical protein